MKPLDIVFGFVGAVLAFCCFVAAVVTVVVWLVDRTKGGGK